MLNYHTTEISGNNVIIRCKRTKRILKIVPRHPKQNSVSYSGGNYKEIKIKYSKGNKMKNLAKLILLTALIAGFSFNAKGTEVGISAGTVDKTMAAGAYVKKGKYSADIHVGATETKNVISVGVSRQVLKLEDIGLAIEVGLSSNKSSTNLGTIRKVRTYQSYDLGLNYKLNKINLRTGINSNGDLKLGIGFSF